MHLLIPVFFNSPSGGLHENVLQTANYLKSKGNQVTVICKPGVFSQTLEGLGIDRIESNFATSSFLSILDIVSDLHKKSPISLIHSHPFASRKVAIIISQNLGIPLVITVHGRYLDDVTSQPQFYDKIITVSHGIGNYLIANGLQEPEKLFTSPNTPDSFFLEKSSDKFEGSPRRDSITIALATRLDADKQFILDIFSKAISSASQDIDQQINWLVIGDGEKKSCFQKLVDSIKGKNSVSFMGWLEGRSLKDAYTKADIIVAPGRCALEAMACGVVTIGLGSKGYIGIIGPQNWELGIYSNFGGLGAMHDSYQEGSIETDIKTLVSSEKLRKEYGIFGKKIIETFYNKEKVNKELLNLYEIVCEAKKLIPRQLVCRANFLELQIKDLFVERDENRLLLKTLCFSYSHIEFAWYVWFENQIIHKQMYKKNNDFLYCIEEEGDYFFQCFITDNKGNKISFTHSKCTYLKGKITNVDIETAKAVMKYSKIRSDAEVYPRTKVAKKLNFVPPEFR